MCDFDGILGSALRLGPWNSDAGGEGCCMDQGLVELTYTRALLGAQSVGNTSSHEAWRCKLCRLDIGCGVQITWVLDYARNPWISGNKMYLLRIEMEITYSLIQNEAMLLPLPLPGKDGENSRLCCLTMGQGTFHVQERVTPSLFPF